MRDEHDAALLPSIALAALIRPSRRVRALLLLAALVQLGAAFGIIFHALDVALPWLLVGASCLAAALCASAAAQPLNVRRIDISKAGALHLTVQQKLPDPGSAVRLLPGSLLWGRLLVLRLGSIDNPAAPVQTVLVLPDSMGQVSFRALAVAMRAIAGRGGADDVQKIG